MSGEANKDEDKGASPADTSGVVLQTSVPNDGDLSKFVPLEGKNENEPENGTSEKKAQSSSSEGATVSMQGQYSQYGLGGAQPHYLYPQQQQIQSSAPSSPSHGADFEAQAAVFMQQQGASPGNPFRQNPAIPNVPLTAQTQSAPPSTQGGVGVLASTAFSSYNPHLEGEGSNYVPTGSPVQSAYTSQGTGMYPYGDGGMAETHHWPDRMQGQHLYQPHHLIQPQQMAMPHYLHPHSYGSRNSPPFDEMTPTPAPENQESLYMQGSMSGSNLAAAPLWGYHPQMPQMDYASHAMPAKPSPPHPHHYPYVLTPGPPIQTTDSNKGPEGANLFIFHIPNNFTNLDMYNLFAPFGQLVSVRIMVEKDTGRSRGFGFVSYDNAESAAMAIKELNGLVVANKRLKVQHKQIRASDHPHPNVHQQEMEQTQPPSNFDLNVDPQTPLWPKPFPEEAMAKISQELETSKTEKASPVTEEKRSQDPKFPQQQLRQRTNRKESGLNRMGTLRNALPESS